ncbi:DUF1769-domain-containing protein [Obba rivulosa]|uniref:DUF1769-domain-containing protein n=1 Tax=Obba rivulosa TaxID=1052685 RepID=A0A8E2ASN8_9APHY|nr:DUF1769-domain-containing protein [Obba rivulosa]
MPRLRVLAGPSASDLVPIEVNSGKPYSIKSDAFEGQVAVFIKGFTDEEGNIGDSPYFEHEERKGVTWSIQVQGAGYSLRNLRDDSNSQHVISPPGRFLRRYTADDVVFGNIFERPLKLPWGFGAALKFMRFIDPTLEQDLASQSKPWALSPLITTMPYLQHRRITRDAPPPPFPPPRPISDDISSLRPAHEEPNRSPPPKGKRRAVFQSAARRQEVVFGPEDLITADFCYDYLQFSPGGIVLRLPGGITIDMLKYWDGQPVRFVCCERKRAGGGGEPWGRVLWCVAIEVAEEDTGEKGDREDEVD